MGGGGSAAAGGGEGRESLPYFGTEFSAFGCRENIVAVVGDACLPALDLT